MAPIADSYDGDRHPELILPHEAFSTLVRLSLSDKPRLSELAQRGWTRDVERLGLPADFWRELRAITTIYVADMRAEEDIGRSLQNRSGQARDDAQQALKLKQIDVCRSRADALAEARRRFGAERFDRFLYEVIAPGIGETSDQLPPADILRRHAGGCR